MSDPAPPTRPTPPTRRAPILLPWLLAAAGALLYANGLRGPFIFDDHFSIAGNEPLRAMEFPWAPPAHTPLSARPVVAFSFALNHALGGLDVRGYHAVNIALHVLAALVLYGVVRRTLLLEGLRARFGAASAWLAAAAALLWMVHPVQTECVNYLTQRTESLMSLFYLLTLYGAVRSRVGSRAWAAVAVLACALGMATKESMVTAPVMVALFDWAYRSGPWAPLARRRAGLYAGLAGTWLILAALMAGSPRGDSVGAGLGVTQVQYALNQLQAIARYMKLAVWPSPLTIDYGEPGALSLGEVAPAALVVLLALASTAALLLLRPRAGYPAAWFFALLAPTSSVVPITTEVAAERRMYLALAGLVALAVCGAYAGLEALRARRPRAAAVMTRAAAGLVLAVAAIFAAMTRARTDLYSRPADLWRSAVACVPGNFRAHSNLGALLLAEGRLDESMDHHQRAMGLKPGSAIANNNFANALLAAGRLDEAIEHYRAAIRDEPGAPEPRYNLATALARQGRFAEAAAEYEEITRMRPRHADAQRALGKALAAIGRPAEGLERLREAMRLEPGRAECLRDAAWLLATCPDERVRDGAEALRLATRAIESARVPAPIDLDVLAAACAEAGEFERAADAAGRAADAAEAAGRARYADQIRERRDSYRKRLPWRSQYPAGL
jgi:tetratricopeptide (TPR) repeat protein